LPDPRLQRVWLAAGIVALLAGAAVGYYVLRPLPRPASIDPDPGYLIVDSAATDANAPAPPKPARGDPPEPGGHAVREDLILDTPKPGALVESPLWVVGQARGRWYFEAEFPARLYDANDSMLTWASARANGDWMTADFVPFATILNFAEPKTATGSLVLERSNPSGLPEHAAEVRLPVRFR